MGRAILWFRRDLRLTDNPALQASLASGQRLIPLYLHAPEEEQPWSPGAAGRWWLHQSLRALDGQLRERGSRLLILRGPTLDTLRALIAREGVTHLYWNRLYEPAIVARDTRIKQALQQEGVLCHSFNAALWHEPWEVHNRAGAPYRVFTPFWRSCRERMTAIGRPRPAPAQLPSFGRCIRGLPLAALELLPRAPWDVGLAEAWTPGEAAALARLKRFKRQALAGYAGGRDRPDIAGTSRLSPHLHFGEIGPRQILQALNGNRAGAAAPDPGDPESFLRELGWREFAHHLLYHFPHTDQAPLDPRFDHFPWSRAGQRQDDLRAWQRGLTGIPIVDAGLRELWRTGWMHNRVRMIVASLLTKNLGIHWLDGARWFWDTLVDADLPANTLGWQWTAGCGADAAPFFRIFNPVSQGRRFDPQGRYVRRWLPELAGLPDGHLHAPWESDRHILARAGVRLGEHYPLPIVDLRASRMRALSQWNRIK